MYYDSDLLSTAIGFVFLVLIIAIVYLVALVIARWKIYKRAGYEGWESLIPFYSEYVLCDIVFGKGLYFLFLVIPSLILAFERTSGHDLNFISRLASFVSSIFSIILYYRLAKVFNKSSGFGVGLALLTPIFALILAFDSGAYYSGPSAKAASISYGYGNAGSYGGYGGYNDYQTYGENNPQGYPNDGYNQQSYNQQGYNQPLDYQNNGYQNNGFQAQGQSQSDFFKTPDNGFQVQGQSQNNPFEQPNNNNYYGSNSDYSGYNNQDGGNNNNGGFNNGGF